MKFNRCLNLIHKTRGVGMPLSQKFVLSIDQRPLLQSIDLHRPRVDFYHLRLVKPIQPDLKQPSMAMAKWHKFWLMYALMALSLQLYHIISKSTRALATGPIHWNL